MKNKTWSCIVMIMLLSFFVALASPDTASAELRLGILPRLSAMEMAAMFNPLAEYLAQETGEKVSLVIPKDFAAFQEAFRAGQMDIAFSNPVIYVLLKKEAGAEPIALSSEFKNGTRFRGIIIARKDSGIEKLRDLKGKKLIFVDKDSAAGFIFQILLLSKAGLDVKKDFIQMPFAKKHDNVTMAVFNKTADAGGIREDDLDKMKDKVDISQLKIVGYTDYFPNWPVFARSKLSTTTIDKIRTALLKLPPNSANSKAILGAARLTGFVAVSDEDFENLRKAAANADAL